jgi:HSP20 family protein
MKIIKHENASLPLAPFDALFDRLNWSFPALDRAFSEGNGELATRLPRTNVQETDSAYVLTLEMPGLRKEDIDVNFEDDTLIVKGERSEETEDKGVVRREFRSTRFERSFAVKGTDRDQIKAKMEDGILTITLPKTPEKVGRKIDVA